MLIAKPVNAPAPLLAEAVNRPDRGRTVPEVADYYRVNAGKVGAWLASGKLDAMNTAKDECGKQQIIILPHHLAEFERKRGSSHQRRHPDANDRRM